MAIDYTRTAGTDPRYKDTRGGSTIKPGMYVGEVRQVVDNTRSGVVRVWIEKDMGEDKNDEINWRSVRPVSPFYGTTDSGVNQPDGQGNYIINKHSYGMWFTPPDIGTKLVCFFADNDPNFGYYLGAVIEQGVNHMLPAIGASSNYKLDDGAQTSYFSSCSRLPVTEYNDDNQQLTENPRFYDSKKPIHSLITATMLQQGVLKDPVRGVIGSSAQRETPSACYGISTPGRPIYLGGMQDKDILRQVQSGAVSLQDATVVARKGGHTIVLDDGDLSGNDALVRIRTAKGHQITMSDSGDCFFIIHANGHSWMEFGKEGTVDVYSANSINLRTQGDLNLHADRNININAKGSVNIKGDLDVAIESKIITANAEKAMLLYSDSFVGIKSDGTLSLQSNKSGTWEGGGDLILSAGCISLNGGSAPEVPKPSNIFKQNLPDTKWVDNKGWEIQTGEIKTIVSRAPTHQPYSLSGLGITGGTEVVAPSPPETSEDIKARVADPAVQNALENQIDIEDLEREARADSSIGSLEDWGVTAVLAQNSKDAGQNKLDITAKGIGRFAATPAVLEANGYLKPGTNEFFIPGKPGDLLTDSAIEICRDPSVWTGKQGITNMYSFLTNSELQKKVQEHALASGYNQLVSRGVITGQENPDVIAGLTNAAARHGPEAVQSWIKNDTDDSSLVKDINRLVRAGQYAYQFAKEKVNEAIKGFSTVAIGASNTINRLNIDEAVRQVINNPKISPLEYTNPFNIYQSVSNENLVYGGDDPIVIDNINRERRSRGLSDLSTEKILGGNATPMPSWVIPPPPGAIVSAAMVELLNPLTGERWTAPSGGFSVNTGAVNRDFLG